MRKEGTEVILKNNEVRMFLHRPGMDLRILTDSDDLKRKYIKLTKDEAVRLMFQLSVIVGDKCDNTPNL
jgi:hypothetical protein